MYSGGSDSHNILQVFREQKLHIDELRIYYPVKYIEKRNATPDPKSPFGIAFEYQLAVLPRLKEFEDYLRNTKITIIDTTENIFEKREGVINDKYSDAFLSTSYYHAIRMVTQNENLHSSDFPNDTCVIYGSDKPSLALINNRVQFHFSDVGRSGGASHLYSTINHSPELFYWAKDFPLIPIKQSHVIKNFIEKNGILSQNWKKSRENWYLKNLRESTLVKTLLYGKNYNPNIFQRAIKAKDDGMFMEINELYQKINSFDKSISWYKNNMVVGQQQIIISRMYDLGELK